MTTANPVDADIGAFAKDFTKLLRELAGASPSCATGIVMMRRAADHLEALLAVIDDQVQAEAASDAEFGNLLDPARTDLHKHEWSHLPPMAVPGEEALGHPPLAAEFKSAAWPVTVHENSLPLRSLNPDLECGAAEGRWLCNAVQGHAPLDHVTFAPVMSRLAGSVLARWPSVHTGARGGARP